jgi:hypothetical protein
MHTIQTASASTLWLDFKSSFFLDVEPKQARGNHHNKPAGISSRGNAELKYQ